MRQISFRVLVGATIVLTVVGIVRRAGAQVLPAEAFAPPGAVIQPRPAEPVGLQRLPTADPVDRLILGMDTETARERLQLRLIRVLDQVDQMYDLTPEQEKKLELAGRGDIKRFFDRFSELKKQLDQPEGDRIEVRLAARDIQSLQQEFQRGYFEDDSLFSKTLKKLLAPEQRARYEDRDRVSAYATRVHWVLMPLRRELGLSRAQHLHLLELVAKETRPLERYGELDEDAILLQASRLPEAHLRPIFDDSQWRRLKRRFDLARRMESILIEGGYLARGKK